jgi:putative restriction endonuclease
LAGFARESREMARELQGINAFFRETLGANLSNARWSWGATNPFTSQIFLRVWADEFAEVEGKECIAVFGEGWISDSPGLPERRRHVELLRAGVQGFGVLCWAEDPTTTGPRKIDHFDHDTLLKLGRLVEAQNTTYAEVLDRPSVSLVATQRSDQSTLVPDLKSILRRRTEITTQQVLVAARLGQGLFRANVLNLWNSKCCVTGTRTREAIRASHIKAWRDSTDIERMDPRNGLPLVATLDALFDAGLISFSDEGSMLVSPLLDGEERQILLVRQLKIAAEIHPDTASYLRFHRGNYFISTEGGQ